MYVIDTKIYMCFKFYMQSVLWGEILELKITMQNHF